MKDGLGDRMKRYESTTQGLIQHRTPTIIRVDGKAFHTYTKGMVRPFDDYLRTALVETMGEMCGEIQNVVYAYHQSDEISFLLNDWKKYNTSQWFDGKIQKMASVAASLATGFFNEEMRDSGNRIAFFDARVFNIPKEEVSNYFRWRIQDAERNSVQMLGRAHFSHKELHGLRSGEVIDKLRNEKDIHWDLLDGWWKRGSVCYRNPDDEWFHEDMGRPPSWIIDAAPRSNSLGSTFFDSVLGSDRE